ncbi:DUF2294 domain-containing protein [Bacillus sp. FJAT-44742]|uniref:DUF2294 domain-containing protein n=1 Tax=Bacillus sp. FJAT-44742 TaxID=2014005 RepID=UPI000C23176D|nr:Na-translocating system protein MpsC family protein [Bacillus sp. FJAT-44742]
MTKENKIAAYVGKMIRDHFGKGPRSVYVTIAPPYITMHLDDFLGPMESVLLGKNEQMTVFHIREKLMAKLLPEIKTYIFAVTDIEVKDFYYDWNLANKTGMFMGTVATNEESKNVDQDFSKKDVLEQETIAVSEEVQKAPDNIYSAQVNDRGFLVVREGILVPIEKEMISLGFVEDLKVAKRKLEKRKLHEARRFEKIFNKKIKDIFVDWETNLDKSITTFLIDPK